MNCTGAYAIGLSVIACPVLALGDPPTYVESSSGLEQPGMEAGNTEFEIGDVNGDGNPDILSTGDHGSPFVNSNQHGVMVWFGDGAGNWSLFQNGNFGYGGIAIGDADNDGLMDVAYGMHHDWGSNDFGDQLLEVARGDGTGRNWSPWDDGLATNGEDWGMFGTDFADVDNDGDLDVGSISFGCCAGLHVYANNMDGTWTQSWGFVGGNASMLFEFGDFNNDGHADFATAHGNGTVYFGDGTGMFTRMDGGIAAGPWRRGTSVGDVTGDGADDLAFRTGDGILVYSWLDGQWDDISGTLGTAGSFDLTEIVDMDLDGFGDIVAFTDSLVVIFGGDGAGNWTEIARIIAPAACDYSAMRAGVDVDHNGYPDIVIVQEENCRPFVGGVNRPRFYKEASIPTDSFIYPKYPRGGEVWRAGSVRFIDWHAGVPLGLDGEPTMTLEISLAGPVGPWEIIAADLPNSGRHQWVVPSEMASDNAYLRYTLGTNPATQAVTPLAFEIRDNSDIAELSNIVMVDGELIAGGIVELEDSDDAYVETEARVTGEVAQPHLMVMRLTAHTMRGNPTQFDITIEGRITDVEAQTTLRLRDWANGGWAEVDQYSMGLNEAAFATTVPNASDYVRSSDGRIRMEVEQIVFFPFTLGGFHTLLDHVEIVVR